MAFLKVRILSATFVLMIAGVSAFAQGASGTLAADSLEAKLKETTDASERASLLVQISSTYKYINYQRAKTAADEAIKFALESKDNKQIPKAYAQASELASLSGDYSTALMYDNAALEHLRNKNDSSSLGSVYNYIGNDYYDLGQYDEAYRYFTQSHKIADAIDDSLLMVKAVHNVGRVFMELGRYENALAHFAAARKIGIDIKDDDGLGYLLDEKADVLLRQKKYDEARKLLDEAIKVIRERNLVIIETRALTKLAVLSLELGDYDAAIMYYDSASVLHRKHDNEFGVAETELGKSKVYLAQNKFKEAEALLLKASSTARQLNARKLETDSYRHLSVLAEKKGDFKNALQYYKAHKTLEDSLISHDMVQKLYQSQLRFETETKDSEIASLTKSNAEQENTLKRKNFLFNILAVVVALCAVLLFSIYRSGQRRIRINKLLMEHQAEIKKRSVELEQLNQVKDKFFSIISHDLRSPMNALAGILDLAEKKHLDPKEFVQLTKELRIQFNHTKTLINNLLDWTLLQMDKLQIHEVRVDLRAMVDENFKLLEATQAKNTVMKNLIPENTFASADTNMINLVFRNLILNAIKFTEVGGLVTVGARAKDNMIEVAVSDNGVGISPEVQKILFEKTSGYSTRGTANEKGTGLGLILTKEFVERNGGTIWLESEVGKGSTFHFTLKKA